MKANPRPIRKAERERVTKALQARELREALTALAKIRKKYSCVEALCRCGKSWMKYITRRNAMMRIRELVETIIVFFIIVRIGLNHQFH